MLPYAHERLFFISVTSPRGLPGKPVSIRGLLRQDRTLAVLLPEAERLRQLNRRFAGTVPAAVARACQIVALSDGEAFIQCASGAAANRLRSQSTGIARVLSTETAPVERLRVKVRADWSQPEPREKHGMGSDALAAWDDLDRQLPDSELKDAVERLLGHQRRGR